MKLVHYRVRKYRNIIDSGRIDVDRVAVLVGQNECGKSNLLVALHKLLPFDDQRFRIDEDWPIDQWATKDPATVPCEAVFQLREDEYAALMAVAAPPRPPSDESSSKEGDQRPEMAPSSSDAIGPDAVAPFLVTVGRNYENEYNYGYPNSVPSGFDTAKADQWMKTTLPRCVYMDDYSTFAGRADLDTLNRLINQRTKLSPEQETIRIVLDLAAIDIKNIIGKAGTEEGRTLRGFDTNAASLHLSRQFKHNWKQKGVKFHLRVDGPTLDIHVEDLGLDAFVPLTSRSRGFQWFISFIWRFTHASKGEFRDCILLLDEPGIHLHHAGHADLLEFFETLAETNTVLYSTHLSTMLDTCYPERVRIIEVRDHHTEVINSVVSPQREPMMVIEARLGLSPAMSGLLGSRQNLVVEGADDVIILHKLSGVLLKSNEAGLSDRIYLLPAHGAPKTPMYAAFLVGNQVEAAVMLDSDPAGRDAGKKIGEQCLKDVADGSATKFQILMLGDLVGASNQDFAIEDLFPTDFYLEAVNRAYGTNISADELPPAKPETQLAQRVENAIRNRGRGDKLDKRIVRLALQRAFNKIRTKDELPDGTYAKARKLIDGINSAFGGSE